MRFNSCMSGRGEKLSALRRDLAQAPGAKIIVPAFEHGEMEFHRQNLGQHRQVFPDQLLLQIDGVRGDDRFLVPRDSEKNRRNQIGQALAHAGAGLDDQIFPLFQRARDRHGHLLLLRAIFEIARFGQQARWGKISSICGTKPGGAPGGLQVQQG